MPVRYKRLAVVKLEVGDAAADRIRGRAGVTEAADTDRFVDVGSRAPRPEPLPADWDPTAASDLG